MYFSSQFQPPSAGSKVETAQYKVQEPGQGKLLTPGWSGTPGAGHNNSPSQVGTQLPEQAALPSTRPLGRLRPELSAAEPLGSLAVIIPFSCSPAPVQLVFWAQKAGTTEPALSPRDSGHQTKAALHCGEGDKQGSRWRWLPWSHFGRQSTTVRLNSRYTQVQFNKIYPKTHFLELNLNLQFHQSKAKSSKQCHQNANFSWHFSKSNCRYPQAPVKVS